MRHRLFRTAIVLGLLLQVFALFGQLSTEDHLADPGFWPTQAAASRKEFTGPQACASCHASKFASAHLTGGLVNQIVWKSIREDQVEIAIIVVVKELEPPTTQPARQHANCPQA
jgi:hypothetical protein